jgi:hypothetical protein
MTRKQKQATIVSLGILIGTVFGAVTVVAAQPGPRVWVDPPQLEVAPGEEFLVQVVIEDGENLGGFQFDLVYDPSVLEVKDAALGDFLGSTGRSVLPLGPEVDDQDGTTVFGAASFGEPPGADGSGVLATITCVARGAGSSALQLRDVQVLDTQAARGSATLEDGQVVVGGAGAAAPTDATATTESPDSGSGATSSPTTESPDPGSGVTSSATPGSERSASDPSPAPAGMGRWAWIAGGAVLGVALVAVLAFAVLRRRPNP